jgi:MORN repeat.
MRQGIGEMVSEDGAIYKGSWYKNKKDGYGIEELSDGTIYSGEWRKGHKNGRGRIKNNSENHSYGIWIEGKLELPSTEKEVTLFLKNKYSYFNGFDKEN